MSRPFTYTLPPSRIAQRPVRPYHAARLLIVNRKTGQISEGTFFEIAELFAPGDTLVLNNSKVIPARLFGTLLDTALQVEVLLTKEIETGVWECAGRPLKKLEKGAVVSFANELTGTVHERISAESVLISFSSNDSERDITSLLQAVGNMPIPPYIREGVSDQDDRVDYQCCFAEQPGSIAAPTAGLHFTPELMERLQTAGVKISFITMHLGPWSIKPIERALAVSAETLLCDKELCNELQDTKGKGGRVVAVGTSTVRALESMFNLDNTFDGQRVETTLAIQPGFAFNLIDTLVTNFHQPGSSHLALVEAFMGRALLEEAYEYALNNDFRFLSYGDGMLVI